MKKWDNLSMLAVSIPSGTFQQSMSFWDRPGGPSRSGFEPDAVGVCFSLSISSDSCGRYGPRNGQIHPDNCHQCPPGRWRMATGDNEHVQLSSFASEASEKMDKHVGNTSLDKQANKKNLKTFVEDIEGFSDQDLKVP